MTVVGDHVATIPDRAMPRRMAGELVREARSALAQARVAASASECYAAAHLAALRTASAVLAVRAHPVTRGPRTRRGSLSVWTLLARVAPEHGEWAAVFAAGASLRAAAEAGVRGAVSQRQADDLLRDAERFLLLVDEELHRPWTSLAG